MNTESTNHEETQRPAEPAVRPRESAMLVLQRGAESGRVWPLDRTRPISIGRNEDCDIVLPDRQVSRHHARISWDGERFLVEDLGSKNGTHVNGQEAAEPIALRDGDEVQIALRFKLAFVDAGATAPLSLEGGDEGLRLDKETRQVWVNNTQIDPPLSLHQFRLLEALWDAGGSVITRDQVIEAVWPEASSEGVSEQAIDALVRRLRERVAETDEEFRYIITVRGHGFRSKIVETAETRLGQHPVACRPVWAVHPHPLLRAQVPVLRF